MKGNFKFLSRLLVVMVFITVASPLAFHDAAAQSEPTNPQEETEVDVMHHQNDVLGVAITFPARYQILEDQYLSQEYGFILVDSEGNPIFDVSWLYEASPEQQDSLAEEIVQQVSSISITQSQIQVDGRTSLMLAPVPGVVANTLIYVSVNERLYTLRYYGDALDDLGWSLVRSVSFYSPKQSLEDLQLTHADDVLYISSDLEQELKPEDREPLPELDPENPSEIPASIAPGCTTWGSTVRTQWGSTANGTGKSSAGPFFYGAGTHTDYDSNTNYNDYYALDHPLNEWNLVYTPRSGTILMIGWAQQGWTSLGRTIVISHGAGYWSVSAHLRAFASGLQVGSWVNSNLIIGYAGGSGYDRDGYWGVHLHESVTKDALLFTSGGTPIGIYDGQSARPAGYTYSCFGGGTYWPDLTTAYVTTSLIYVGSSLVEYHTIEILQEYLFGVLLRK